MALPVPPTVDNPIPNNPFYSIPAYITRGAYYPITVGAGLSVDPVTAVITSTGGGGGAVTSLIAGPGISVSSATGNVTVTNIGVTNILAGTGISISGGTGSVTINSLTNGTVTAVTAGVGLTGGTITTTGTIALGATGVSSGTYTNPSLTVDIYGRIIAASNGTSVSSVTGALPITVTSGTNPIIGINPATTASCGAVLLSDAANNPSSATAATSLAVKTVYDIAIAAIPKSCITGKGALITGTGASTPVALPVGTDGQVLTACGACVGGLYWAPVGAVSIPQATPTLFGTVYGCSDALNTSLGLNAFLSGGSASNVAIGINALCGSNTGFGNTAVGARALRNNTTSSANVGVGLCALVNNTTGESNVGVGPQALRVNTTGSFNVGVGSCALLILDGGDCNVAIGLRSGCNISTGCNNVAIGCGAQVANGAGNNQLAIGFSDLDNWLTGDANKAIQPGAGIIDCTTSCGTADMVLTSQGNAIQWKTTSSVKPAPNYGNFLSTATQTITTPGTPQAVTLNTTVAANNFSLVAPSRITAAVAGIYNLQFSIQLLANPGGGGDVEIWLAKNGNAVPASNTRFSIKNTNEAEFVALNYIESLAAGDYLELIWSTGDVDNFLFATTAAPPTPLGGPAIPSAIVTIVPVGA